MAHETPNGRTLDMDFMFTKLQVDDIQKSSEFYSSVVGLVEMHRMEATITGRSVSEVVYMPTYAGGPMFILIKFHDAPKPRNDEVILGFSTKDLDAFLGRLEKAGGRALETIQDAMFRHAFVEDPEGHLLQVTQPIA